MDRERMLDMDRLVAPVRQKSFVVIAAALLVCGPWVGWWTIIPLAGGGVLFEAGDAAAGGGRRALQAGRRGDGAREPPGVPAVCRMGGLAADDRGERGDDRRPELARDGQIG